MLYSYLLNHTDFHIVKAPLKDTADARYAFSLYQTLLLVVLELSGYKVNPSASRSPLEAMAASNMLAGGKMAKALSADGEIRALIGSHPQGVEAFDGALLRLYNRIIDSTVYKDLRKNKKKQPDMADEVRLWVVLLETVIASEPLMVQAARKDPAYTAAGYRMAFDMAADTLRNFQDTRSTLLSAKKQLNESLELAHHLYYALLMLPVAIADLERERLEKNKEKYCPTPQDLNPDMRFADNAYVEAIRNHPDVLEYTKKHPVSWLEDRYLLRDMLDQIKATDTYRQYMEAPETSWQQDVELWRTLLRQVVFPSDALAETLEGKSIYWNDDLSIMGTFVLKTLRQLAQGAPDDLAPLQPIYKDDDDAAFGPELFTLAVNNRDLYRSYIERFVNGQAWDAERMAFMDFVILLGAVTELLNFPSVPVPVTLNEYIEIANYYSTPRSGQFVNGLLYTLVNTLKEEGVLNK